MTSDGGAQTLTMTMRVGLHRGRGGVERRGSRKGSGRGGRAPDPGSLLTRTFIPWTGNKMNCLLNSLHYLRKRGLAE